MAGVELSRDLLSQFSLRQAIQVASKFPATGGIPESRYASRGLSTCKYEENYSPAAVVSEALKLSSIPTELRGYYSGTPDSLLLPLPSDLKRATISQSNTGAQLVGTATQELIQALRPSPLLESLGVLMPIDLTGGTAQLIGTDAAAPSAWYSEGSGPASPGIGSTLGLELRAKTLISVTEISYQALHQVSDKAEVMLLDDLLAGVRSGLEAAVFAGTGAPAPTGVVNTAGVQAVTYGTPSPTRAQLLSQMDQLAAVNVDLAACAWVVHPRMAVKLHAIATFGFDTANGASMPIYDGQTLLGLPVKVSANCPATKVILGDWRQCAVPIWGRVEIARAGALGIVRADGAERYRAMVLADVGLLRPAAFSVGTATS